MSHHRQSHQAHPIGQQKPRSCPQRAQRVPNVLEAVVEHHYVESLACQILQPAVPDPQAVRVIHFIRKKRVHAREILVAQRRHTL